MTGQCQCGCAGFTRSEEYVWYYHSGRGTVRLFRRHDAAMVANYALAAEATALVSTSWSLVAGDREGGLTMLAITDPAAGQQAAAQLLASLPSRQRGNTEPVNGGLMRSPLARYCTALYCTVLHCTAGHEGAVADISCMSIFSACFGLPTTGHNLVRSDLDFLLNSTPF